MTYDYEYFKKAIYELTKIDLNAYKEKQMKRRIDTLIAKNKIVGYDKYVSALKSNRNMFENTKTMMIMIISGFRMLHTYPRKLLRYFSLISRITSCSHRSLYLNSVSSLFFQNLMYFSRLPSVPDLLSPYISPSIPPSQALPLPSDTLF